MTAAALVTALRVLHREFERDECCDPPQNAPTCRYVTVCEECGYEWPCATVRLLPTENAQSFGESS